MTPDPNPASAAGAAGSGDVNCWAAIGTSDNATRPILQGNSPGARHLRLVPPPPRPQPRYEVRIAISPAVGRSRPFHLSESDIDELIAIALRLEARRA
jgi:hypothetical protein